MVLQLLQGRLVRFFDGDEAENADPLLDVVHQYPEAGIESVALFSFFPGRFGPAKLVWITASWYP